MTDKIINFNAEREKILKEKMKKAMEERGIKFGKIYACKIDEVCDMTDKDIIKALKCCEIAYDQDCTECPLYPDDGEIACREVLREEALDLITCQQAEIENLKVENQSLRGAANSLKMHYEEAQAEIENYKHLDVILHTAIDITANIKSEAVKEFAERLKEKFVIADCIVTIDNNDIDNLVKEIIGENNG